MIGRRLGSVAAVALWVAGFGSIGSAAVASAGEYIPPACPSPTYRSAPGLGAEGLCMNVGIATHGTEPGTYLFLSDPVGAGIFKDDGTLVWWRPHAQNDELDYNLTEIRLSGHPYLALWTGSAHKLPNSFYLNDGSILLFNDHYQQVGQITAGAPFKADDLDPHDLRITPQGNALVGIYDPVRVTVGGHSDLVVQYVVQELSLVQDASGIHTGRVLFQWRSLEHVPAAKSYLPNTNGKSAWDYFHGNSIAQDSDGNLLVSGRNTWGIYEISTKSGKILWQIGGKGDAKLPEPWCYQHDIVPLGNDEYTLFDDGGVGPSCAPGSTRHPARALIIKVNPSQHPAAVKVIRAYTHAPPIQSGYLGSVQRLADNDVLVDYGDMPEVTEYSPDGHKLMDLSISYPSYRAYRFAWDGDPAAPPDAVAADISSTSTEVWASWNGSTSVVSWQVVAGLDGSDLIPVGRVTPKSGFETQIVVPGRYPEVAVEAIGANGAVLATSKPVVASAS
jgi:Arylsulfotransferase (ASST)